ncbi:3 beta-hydroxysteroid dehydrogenase/Delta 5--_4-isomerase [Alphaproteobacteria bacterium SO-S41]|nr:3 beta-hydroxysteroid dehydrogenase/Delta 5-->4-isomerase [Alphaproteobacteria bacterium SO-S41]
MPHTVLVTGGTGYVAGWVIVRLLEQGYGVRTTVRSPAKEAAVRTAVATVTPPGDALTFATADLLSDAGWDAAMAGIDYVLHVASPMDGGAGDGASAGADLTTPAREGTLRVLRAAVKAGVKRVVFTSSCAACAAPLQGPDSFNDETVWTDPNDPANNAYRRSKILAERAAWDFMASEGGATEFVTVLPSAIFGPTLNPAQRGSVQVINAILRGKMPGLFKTGFCVVDVRDLADLHIKAMTAPEAVGQRFIGTGEFMWVEDVATTLRTAFGARAPKIPTRRLPNWLVRLAARFMPPLRALTPTLGRKHVFNSAKSERVLGWKSRPAKETIIACAESLLAADST